MGDTLAPAPSRWLAAMQVGGTSAVDSVEVVVAMMGTPTDCSRSAQTTATRIEQASLAHQVRHHLSDVDGVR